MTEMYRMTVYGRTTYIDRLSPPLFSATSPSGPRDLTSTTQARPNAGRVRVVEACS